MSAMYAPALVTYRSGSSSEWRAAVREDSRIADLKALGFAGTTRDLLKAGHDTLQDLIDRASEKTSVWREIEENFIFGPPVPDPDTSGF
jgi:hypothetical protein